MRRRPDHAAPSTIGGGSMNPLRLAVVVVPLAVLSVVPRAHAQLLLSTNDNKVTLVNGVATVVKNPPPDTLTVIDIKTWPPQVVAELEVPGSVVGPPFSVAVAPDESIALVTANEKLDPGDPTKRIPNNTMSVVDLKATPPRIIATLETGRAPAGVSINRAGTLALVANRAEGTVSVYTVQGKTVTPAGKVTVADDKSGTSHAAISPDGKLALVTCSRSTAPRSNTPSATSRRACGLTASTSPPAARSRPSPTSAAAAASPTPSASSISRPSRRGSRAR